MSERGSGSGKFIAVAAVFLAAVGGGAYWFFGVRAKNEQQDHARAEILEWEKRLAAARECLFGKAPASSDSGEALAVRELTPDPWDRSTCTKVVGGIARGVADDTGLMPVEHAWMTLNRAAAKVATAFAVSKDPYGKTAADERRGVSDLPDALRELDQAHAELRQAAKLPPPTLAQIPTLPVAQVVPMLLGGAEITAIDMFPRASAGTVVLWGVTKDTQTQITLVPGEAPRLDKVPPYTVRSMTPGAAWGAAGLGGGVAVSTIDEGTGSFAAPQTISPTGGALLAAVGTFDDSLVAFATDEGIVLAHGKGTPPAFTLDKPIRAGMTQIAFDPIAGRALMAWAELPPLSVRASVDPEGSPALVGTLVHDGSPVQTVAIGTGQPMYSCQSRRHGFVVNTDGQAFRFDASGATQLTVDPQAELAGCGAGGALFAVANTTRFTACDGSTCRAVDLRGARPSNHAALANDHVISVAVRERVLAVWSEKSKPAFYRLPEKVVPRKVISDGKTIDVLCESGTEGKPLHFLIVRVPAT